MLHFVACTDLYYSRRALYLFRRYLVGRWHVNGNVLLEMIHDVALNAKLICFHFSHSAASIFRSTPSRNMQNWVSLFLLLAGWAGFR